MFQKCVHRVGIPPSPVTGPVLSTGLGMGYPSTRQRGTPDKTGDIPQTAQGVNSHPSKTQVRGYTQTRQGPLPAPPQPVPRQATYDSDGLAGGLWFYPDILLAIKAKN